MQNAGSSCVPEELIPLIDYFEDTWIGRLDRRDQRGNSLLPIRLWSINYRVIQGLPRSNNSVEAWHLAFQQTVGLYHPTIYKLVEAMQLEQSHTENIVTMIDQGRDVRKKNAPYETIDRAYRTIVDRYRRIETMDYLYYYIYLAIYP